MDSAVTPLIRLAFLFHYKTFRFWYPFYFKADYEAPVFRVRFITNPFILAPWFTVLIGSIIFAIGIPSFVLFREFLSDKQKLDSVQVSILLLFEFCQILVQSIILLTRKHNRLLVEGFNQLMEMEQSIIRGGT